MAQELGKYYLRFAWLPKTLSDGTRVWLENYYEVHLDLPVLDPVYTIRCISTSDYIVETLRGTIIEGYDNSAIDDSFERMLNAAKLDKYGFKDAEFD